MSDVPSILQISVEELNRQYPDADFKRLDFKHSEGGYVTGTWHRKGRRYGINFTSGDPNDCFNERPTDILITWYEEMGREQVPVECKTYFPYYVGADLEAYFLALEKEDHLDNEGSL